MVNARVITPSLNVDFDPSITEDLLKLVLSYAKQFPRNIYARKEMN